MTAWFRDAELAELERRLAFQRARVGEALPMCGALFDERRSCQLVLGHTGRHAHLSADGERLQLF